MADAQSGVLSEQLRILIVEDDEFSASVVKDFCEQVCV